MDKYHIKMLSYFLIGQDGFFCYKSIYKLNLYTSEANDYTVLLPQSILV